MKEDIKEVLKIIIWTIGISFATGCIFLIMGLTFYIINRFL